MKLTSFKVEYSPLAEKDLRETWRHIAQHNPAAANRFVDEVLEKINAVFDFPESGAPRAELGEGVRMLVVGKRLIFYRVLGDKLLVDRVLHGSQDRTKIFS